jgi:hypothetical protein
MMNLVLLLSTASASKRYHLLDQTFSACNAVFLPHLYRGKLLSNLTHTVFSCQHRLLV